jgi:hypothetical protein
MIPEDKVKLQASLKRLFDIYKQMAVVADHISTYRCPYKDRNDRCTANFGCRNQRRSEVPSAKPICAGDDRLDYRSAWEV